MILLWVYQETEIQFQTRRKQHAGNCEVWKCQYQPFKANLIRPWISCLSLCFLLAVASSLGLTSSQPSCGRASLGVHSWHTCFGTHRASKCLNCPSEQGKRTSSTPWRLMPQASEPGRVGSDCSLVGLPGPGAPFHMRCTLPVCLPLPTRGSAGQHSHGGLAPFLPGPLLCSEMTHYMFTAA